MDDIIEIELQLPMIRSDKKSVGISLVDTAGQTCGPSIYLSVTEEEYQKLRNMSHEELYRLFKILEVEEILDGGRE